MTLNLFLPGVTLGGWRSGTVPSSVTLYQNYSRAHAEIFLRFRIPLDLGEYESFTLKYTTRLTWISSSLRNRILHILLNTSDFPPHPRALLNLTAIMVIMFKVTQITILILSRIVIESAFSPPTPRRTHSRFKCCRDFILSHCVYQRSRSSWQ